MGSTVALITLAALAIGQFLITLRRWLTDKRIQRQLIARESDSKSTTSLESGSDRFVVSTQDFQKQLKGLPVVDGAEVQDMVLKEYAEHTSRIAEQRLSLYIGKYSIFEGKLRDIEDYPHYYKEPHLKVLVKVGIDFLVIGHFHESWKPYLEIIKKNTRIRLAGEIESTLNGCISLCKCILSDGSAAGGNTKADLAGVSPDQLNDACSQDASDENVASVPITARSSSIMFVDLAGWSHTEVDAQLRFFTHALATIAQCLKLAKIKNTWGDGIVAVFEAAEDAANAALELRDYFRRADPDHVDINVLPRIALHYGDIHFVFNAVIERWDIVGHAITIAARLEPKTIKGQVFCSSDFAEQLRRASTTISIKDLGSDIILEKQAGTIRPFLLLRLREDIPLPVAEWMQSQIPRS